MTKRVLVTGGAGFIAHHVIEHILRTTDWQIVSLDRLDFSGNLNRLADVMQSFPAEDRARVEIVFHDLKADVNPMIQDMIGDVNLILHLAAGSHVDRSIEYPMEFVLDNVVGTVNLLQYARTLKNLEQFVYFSTDEVFGPAPKGVSYSERDRYNATNPYSATKAAGEEMCVAFQNTYKLPIIITHTMNVFGERQHPEKFIPMVIQKVRDGEKVTIHANAGKTEAGSRHYIHAKDVAEGLMFILSLDTIDLPRDFGGAKCPKFNLVGPEEIDNLSLAKMIAAAQGKELIYEMVDFHSARPGHDLRYAMSGDYLKSLGWESRIKLSDRINEMVKWSLENNKWLRK
ncbi:MAG TPA: GDP-mannose 4,6-dehydratase [Methanosarcina sp.]|nr:GDP-mannose 4,6-dehydratase [Methanosarcina sp.]